MAKGAAQQGSAPGLTQRLIDNSSNVHKQSNALLLTKVRGAQLVSGACRRSFALRHVVEGRCRGCMAATIAPQMPSRSPPPPPRAGAGVRCCTVPPSRHATPPGGRTVH